MPPARKVPSLPARLALSAIRLYQRHLSPIKGFSCAWRAVTGGASCSAHGVRAIRRHGLRAGLALLERRLQCCAALHRSRLSAPNPLLHHQRGDCDCLDLGGLCDAGCGSACGPDWSSCGGSGGRRPFQRWREKRWLAKAARLQRERLERERRERVERERQERAQKTRGPDS